VQIRNRCYTCGKLMLLSALYDTFEKLGWKLLSTDSETGIINVLDRKTGEKYLIRVQPERMKNVDVIIKLEPGSHSGRDSPEEAVGQLFDTMEQIIRDALAGAPFRQEKSDSLE
jgi:hypothetical protein